MTTQPIPDRLRLAALTEELIGVSALYTDPAKVMREMLVVAGRMREALAEGAAGAEVCVWTQDDGNSRYFHCGGGCFEFSHGETEPEFKWCPYCGKPIQWQEPASEGRQS